MNDAEFKGYVKATLEDIHKDVKEVKVDVKTQNERIRKNEVKISYIFGALAVLGAAIALVKIL